VILIPPLRARVTVAHELSLTKIGFDSGRNRAGERTARKTLATSPTATLSAVFCNRERQRLNGLCQIAVNSRKCNLADSPLQRAGSTGHVQQFCLCHHRKCHITLQMPAWTSFVTSLHETEWSELICSYAYYTDTCSSVLDDTLAFSAWASANSALRASMLCSASRP